MTGPAKLNCQQGVGPYIYAPTIAQPAAVSSSKAQQKASHSSRDADGHMEPQHTHHTDDGPSPLCLMLPEVQQRLFWCRCQLIHPFRKPHSHPGVTPSHGTLPARAHTHTKVKHARSRRTQTTTDQQPPPNTAQSGDPWYKRLSTAQRSTAHHRISTPDPHSAVQAHQRARSQRLNPGQLQTADSLSNSQSVPAAGCQVMHQAQVQHSGELARASMRLNLLTKAQPMPLMPLSPPTCYAPCCMHSRRPRSAMGTAVDLHTVPSRGTPPHPFPSDARHSFTPLSQ